MNEQAKKSVTGLFLVILGVLFLLDSLRIVDFWRAFNVSWPVFLIIIGVYLIVKHNQSSKTATIGQLSEALDTGWGNIRITELSPDTNSFSKSLAFGKITIDLSGFKLSPGTNNINVSVAFGKVEIILPANIAVNSDLRSHFGKVAYGAKTAQGIDAAIKHKDDNYDNAGVRIDIKALTDFGEVNILKV